MGLPDLPVRDQAEDTKRVTHGTDMERTARLLFAAAVALAGVVLVGQALSRMVYGIAEGGSALRVLGFTRPPCSTPRRWRQRSQSSPSPPR